MAWRISGGAAADPRRNDELASWGMPISTGRTRTLLRGEAVKQPVAARLDQRRLAAPGRSVHGIPRGIGAAQPIVMADDRAFGIRAARPVVAGQRRRRADRQPPVRIRSGQDVVLVRLVADSLHLRTLLVERGRLADVVAVALIVTVQVGDAGGDEHALGVVPRPVADTVAGIDGRLAGAGRGAEIRPPGPASGTGGCGQALTMLVGADQAAKVAAVPRPGARDEESHWLWRGLLCWRLTFE